MSSKRSDFTALVVNGDCFVEVEKGFTQRIVGFSKNIEDLNNGTGQTNDTRIFKDQYTKITNLGTSLRLSALPKQTGLDTNVYLAVLILDEAGNLDLKPVFADELTIRDIVKLYPPLLEAGEGEKYNTFYSVYHQTQDKAGQNRRYLEGVVLDEQGNITKRLPNQYYQLQFSEKFGIILGYKENLIDIITRDGEIQLEDLKDLKLIGTLECKAPSYGTDRVLHFIHAYDKEDREFFFLLSKETGKIKWLDPKYAQMSIAEAIGDALSLPNQQEVAPIGGNAMTLTPVKSLKQD